MSSVLLICLTVLLVVATGAFLSVWHARHEAEREDKQSAREEAESVTVAELTERLTKAIGTIELTGAGFDVLGARLERLEEEVRTGINANTKDAVLALSGRVAIMEAAMKSAIAQMVDVTQYTQAKHQQLIAASVRGNSSKRPGAGA